MKKLIVLTACALLALTTSCKKENKIDEEPIVENTEIDTTIIEEPATEIATVETPLVESSESENYDKMLDDYDEYMTEYIKFYKKAMKGDTNAMSEYAAIMGKMTELQKSMEEAKGTNQITAEQIDRMLRIQTKMTNAMKQ